AQQALLDRAASLGRELGGPLASEWKRASQLIPLSFLRFSLGPDHRSHAPELEWGGNSAQFLDANPFDSHVYRSPRETLAYRASGGQDGRRLENGLGELGSVLSRGISPAGQVLARHAADPRIQEAMAGIQSAAAIASYVENRLQAAQDLAELEAGVRDRAVQAALAMDRAARDWQRVVESTSLRYRPLTDRLRMRRHDFDWSKEAAPVGGELRRVLGIAGLESVPTPEARPIRFGAPPLRAVTPKLAIGPREISMLVMGDAVRHAWVLEKPLPSSTFFHRIPMVQAGKDWVLRLPRRAWGHAIAFEIEANGTISRWPREPEAPYWIVPAQEKPTPPIYSSEEAMAYLKPVVLDPGKHGSLLLGTRAWNFHRRFDKSTQRKLLSAVERGLDLVIMQQDFASGRYPLDWLPTKPTIVNRPTTIFDPAGALGMERIETADILWQPIEPGNGWEIHGNGGVASLKHGKGTIWIVQARLVQRMHIPAAARSLKALLKSCNYIGPVVLVDAATENGDSADSIIPDFMNAHDIPFLTLGEVIAQEQGMDSLTPIPGPIAADDILKGQGRDMANRWLKAQVVKAARRPTPSSLGEFETERVRRKKILLQSLGLDPMPPRTPLNARITGTIQRVGYAIDKLVYESRPNFFVTAHLYRPDPMPPGKLPVIVNVNGHWAHKKNEDRIQLRAAFQALQGYLALAIDSPGWSFEGNSPIERRPEGNHNDWKLFFGTNATGIYVWDVIRGLDYLATRSDVDMSRIGITGASGGGLATLYAFAAEDRFSAAASVVYMSSMELAPDNGCLCNHVPGTSQIGDRSDIAAIQAPKPFLIMGAENDPEFPPDAMRLTGQKMTGTWALFNKPESVQTIIFPGGHDYSQPMREASLGFFNKHLKSIGDGFPVPQPVLTAIPSNDPSLLVLNPPAPNERTMRNLVEEMLAAATHPTSAESLKAVNGVNPFQTAKLSETGNGDQRSFLL
ncbi:MAG TPA: prolyl oligopeptidase family serine peptidase, partial [Fimbriimonadaceae bacterium]|nr:prolyl oligopeptidase family serine peptidase [Fimbriimonadaceae bacterium]